jgi:hypothetical protein
MFESRPDSGFGSLQDSNPPHVLVVRTGIEPVLLLLKKKKSGLFDTRHISKFDTDLYPTVLKNTSIVGF